MPQSSTATTTHCLAATQPPRQRDNFPASLSSKDTSLSTLSQVELALGLTGILTILVFALVAMRIKNGLGFTLCSLFSRRSKKGKKGKLTKRCSTVPSTSNDPMLMLPIPKPQKSIPLDKELEILGLLEDPRKESAPLTCNSPSGPACTLNTAASHATSLVFPVVQMQPNSQKQYQSRDDTIFSRQSHISPSFHPPSPLLPPPPSLWLPLQQQPQESQERTSVQNPAETENTIPLSPVLSYRTFATRSSGIFPWGMEPHTADDGFEADTLSEGNVLVLPSPPRFARSYGCGLG
ncbi:hypothetical protein BDW62DRAFT_133315 [Aspergillus aurantiobrunneus]